MKKILLYQLGILPVLFVMWYFVFPDYLWWLEANSFYVSIPDFFSIQHSFPSDADTLVVGYLSQFYRWRIWGALIQSLFPVIILYASDVILYRIVKSKHVLWMAFIPACLFWAFQYGQASLHYSVLWSFVFVLAALCVYLASLLPQWKFSGRKRDVKPLVAFLLPAALVIGTFCIVYAQDENHIKEESYRLEHLAIQHKWDDVLKIATPSKTKQDLNSLRYALLALSEKGQLADLLFSYTVPGPDCFYFERNRIPFCCYFNSLFFDCLGIRNEAIHQAFEEGIQAENGMNFRCFRNLIDWNIRAGNHAVAKKYMKIMEYTTCHKNWLKTRYSMLGAFPQTEQKEDVDAFFIGAYPFVSDMARIVDRDKENIKAVHYVLCALMINKDVDVFMQVFSRSYSRLKKEALPRHYEEVILLLSQQNPAILQQYPVSGQRVHEFKEFCSLMQQGGLSEQLLSRKYGATFWYYFKYGKAPAKA